MGGLKKNTCVPCWRGFKNYIRHVISRYKKKMLLLPMIFYIRHANSAPDVSVRRSSYPVLKL